MLQLQKTYSVFEKEFSTKDGNKTLDGFLFTPDHPGIGVLRTAGGAAIPICSNGVFVRTVPLGDFSLTCHLGETLDTFNRFKIHLYYRFDLESRTGGVLEVERKGNKITCTSAWSNGKSLEALEVNTREMEDMQKWILTLSGGELTFCGKSFALPPDLAGKGMIGFRFVRNWNFAPFVIKSLKVEAFEEMEEKAREDISASFPLKTFHSMGPWIFQFSIRRNESLARIHAAVEGGPVDLPNRMTFYTKHLGNELLENPYFAIVYPDGRVGEKHYIFYGTLGFREHWASCQPAFPPADKECPVREEFYLPPLPEGYKILAGFEHYKREDAQHLPHNGCEMLLDPVTGVILDSRKIQSGKYHISLDSGKNKKIVENIRENFPNDKEAISFAESNHYFFTGEKCGFTVKSFFPEEDFTLEEISMRLTLEDVFGETLSSTLSGALQEEKALFPGEKGVKEEISFKDLAPGVYHLKAELFANDKLLHTIRRAFEVMPPAGASRTAPELSHLPFLFSSQPDFETNGNAFDPKSEGEVDLSHYMAVSGMQVFPATERKEWELLREYGRGLYAWILKRATPTNALEANLELARNSTHLAPGHWRFLINDVYSYTEKERPLLVQFLREKGDTLLAEKVEKSKGDLIHIELLEELLKKYAIEWAAFVSRNHQEKDLPRLYEKWEGLKIDPARICNYSIAPFYVTHTGVAFTALRYGWDMRDMDFPENRNFSLAEDYPYLCGYPVSCTPFVMANLKLDLPKMRLFPEIYGLCAIPADSATIYGNPPLGISATGFRMKRFYDMKYSVSYFLHGEFHYWMDDGFHLKNPSHEDMAKLLESWKNIRKMKPVKPLRTMAIVGGAKCILRHAPRVERKDFYFNRTSQLDLYNTAEDFPAWIWNSGRLNGLPNAFVVKSEEIASLKAEDVSTLVLPPADCLTDEEIAAVRKLHAQGVNLLSAENARGLEDLFGVEKREEKHHVTAIADEVTTSPCNPVEYAPLPGTGVLLKDKEEVPLLTLKENNGAKAAFFTFAPTAFNRIKGTAFKTMSPFLNDFIGKFTRELDKDNAPAILSKGRLTAFMDEEGALCLIAMEDQHPAPGKPISSLLTVRGDLRECRIESDTAYSIVRSDEEKTVIRFSLDVDEARYFRFSPKGK